jgi:hypothetical protein
MKTSRTLVLKRESLTELNADALRDVVGAASVGAVCVGHITVLQPGCASDPRVCHYETTL